IPDAERLTALVFSSLLERAGIVVIAEVVDVDAVVPAERARRIQTPQTPRLIALIVERVRLVLARLHRERADLPVRPHEQHAHTVERAPHVRSVAYADEPRRTELNFLSSDAHHDAVVV